MSSDPAMDGINWYGYVGGNPLGAVDPLGLYSDNINDYRDDPRWEGRDKKEHEDYVNNYNNGGGGSSGVSSYSERVKIPEIPKFDYTENGSNTDKANNYVKAVDNGVIDVVNYPIKVINSLLHISQDLIESPSDTGKNVVKCLIVSGEAVKRLVENSLNYLKDLDGGKELLDDVNNGIKDAALFMISPKGVETGTSIAVGFIIGNQVSKAFKGIPKQAGSNNPVPKDFARVVPANVNPKMLGMADDVFVTALDDIAGLNAKQIAHRLTIPESSSGFRVISFSSKNLTGIASPVNRLNPGFIGRGLTAGGAREFVIPNQVIPKGARSWIIK